VTASLDDVSYVLPLRWSSPGDVDELADYLRTIAALVPQVIVVDGSPRDIFDAHHRAFGGVVTHVVPDPDLDFTFGKVNGVHTGMRRAAREHVILADDDVRYDEAALRQVVELLHGADLVRPQNYFDPMPWHAHWDTGRTLLNRMTGGDYPGTLGVRRSSFRRVGGYDGDVLFENLELERTVRAAGGTVAVALGCYVRRLPPTAAHFRSQRVRQAYDELGRPLRLVAWLALVPAASWTVARRRWWPLALGALTATATAELGRRRAGGAARFPATAALLAPAWVLERAVCSWLALAQRVCHGGVVYGDTVIRSALTPRRRLRARVGGRLGALAGSRRRPLRLRDVPAERDGNSVRSPVWRSSTGRRSHRRRPSSSPSGRRRSRGDRRPVIRSR
jgi:hypothetical protein